MNHREGSFMGVMELERETSVVELIAPDGLGFGEGGISVKDQVDQGILTRESLRRVHEILMNDKLAFKPVEVADDGCGDGRPWAKIIQMVIESGRKIVKYHKSSLLRAKVFGGGLVVAASMWRVVKGAPKSSQTVGQDRRFMADALLAHNFSHGAHSDNHAEGDNCGCGAIDNYPKITKNVLKYRSNITEVLRSIYGDEFEANSDAIDSVFDAYEKLKDEEGYFADASGRESMAQILEAGAVVKELSGHHVEETIVINDVEGTTLDQQYFTEVVKNACVDEEKPKTIQAFCVDIWRGRQIARAVADIAKEQDQTADKSQVYKLAYADFLVRTLAVAATLTAGDLPVYRRSYAQATS